MLLPAARPVSLVDKINFPQLCILGNSFSQTPHQYSYDGRAFSQKRWPDLGCDFEKEEEKNNFSSKIIGSLVKDLTGYETSFRPKVAVFRRKQEFEFQEREQKAKGGKGPFSDWTYRTAGQRYDGL